MIPHRWRCAIGKLIKGNQMLIEKLTELEALLASMTGSAGASELTQTQIQALLNTCQRLAYDALASAQIAHVPTTRFNRLLLRRAWVDNGMGRVRCPSWL